MKRLLTLTALLAGIAMTQQASACEWMHQAGKPATVVTCDNGTCTSEQATQQAAAETAPAAPQPTEQPAPPSPSIVACAGSNC
jgi:hypothetical protein